MAPLPRPFSLNADPIETAISEGRAEEAMQKLIFALRSKEDDCAVRWLAAEWIERVGLPGGAAKKLRKGRNALHEDWLEISQMFTRLQEEGATFAAARAQVSTYFGCSERHVETCMADWNRVEQADEERG